LGGWLPARLAAEAGVITVEIAIGAAVDMSDDDGAALEVGEWSGADYADEVPVAGDPVAAVIVASYPDVSGTRAGRNIGDGAADCESNSSGLSLCGSKAQAAGDQSCCQREFLQACHKSSVPPAGR